MKITLLRPAILGIKRLKKGAVVDLRDARAKQWIRQGRAEAFTPAAAPGKKQKGKTAPTPEPNPTPAQPGTEEEKIPPLQISEIYEDTNSQRHLQPAP